MTYEVSGCVDEEIKIGDRVTVIAFGYQPLVTGRVISMNDEYAEIVVKVSTKKDRIKRMLKSVWQ